MAVGASEAETFWTEFLRALARRGLRGVKLVTSDAHEGLKAAAARVLHASWQRCRVHFMRNVLAHEGKPTVAVSSPPFPRRRAGVALTSVPKFARLFAGGESQLRTRLWKPQFYSKEEFWGDFGVSGRYFGLDWRTS